MAANELSIMLTAKGNLESGLKSARDRVKELNGEIKKTQTSGGTVGDELAAEYRKASIAAVKLTEDLNKVNKQVKTTSTESTTAAGKFGKAWSKAASTFNNSMAAGLSTAALMYFGKQAIQTFAEVQKAQSALKASFGKQGSDLVAWGKANGDALNLSQTQAADAAQAFATLGENAGLRDKQLVDFTTTLTTRSADLASLFGGSTEDAISAIGSALVGMTKPMRQYGVLLNETNVKAEAVAMGISKGTDALTPQQRVLATSNILLRQSAKAQGDVARSSNSLAYQLKDGAQQWADFNDTTGGTLAIFGGPLLKQVNHAGHIFAGLPKPLREGGIALGFFGTAALIATPRIVAMKAAMDGARFSSFLVGAAGSRAAIGLGAATAALVAIQLVASTKDSGKAWSPFSLATNDVKGLTYALSELNNKESKAVNFITGLWGLDKVGLVESSSSLYKRSFKALDGELLKLVGDGKLNEAKQKFDALADSVKASGHPVKELKDLLPNYTGALKSLEVVTGGVARKTKDAAWAFDNLSRSVRKMKDVADFNRSLLQLQRDIHDARATPHDKDAAITAYESFMTAYSLFADGSKAQSQFVLKNYADIESVIKKSSFSKTMENQFLKPIQEAVLSAKALVDLLDTAARINSLNRTHHDGFPDPLKKATGGLVLGNGTATSDSIPAYLSNGEYVMRAKAVSALGVGTLNKLNRGDKMMDPALLSRFQPSEQTALGTASSPLIGVLNVNNPKSEMDIENAVARGLTRAERIRRERG
jgi:hypothetical protein